MYLNRIIHIKIVDMKHIGFILSILISMCLSAQENINIQAATYSGFTGTEASVFLVDVARVQKADYMNHWEKYFKSLTDLPIVRGDNDITIKGATIKKLGSRVLSIYMHFQPSDIGTKVYVGFQDTVTGFIGPDDPQYGIDLKKLIFEETQKVYIQTRGEDVKKEEAYLKSLEKDLASIKNDEAKLQKGILKDKQEIDQLKNDISINEDVMKELVIEIGDKRSAVMSLPANSSKETRKNAESEAKDMEKKRDKLRKNIDKGKQKIFDLEKEIQDKQYELEKLQTDEDEANRKVEAQRDLLIEIQKDVTQMKR